MSNVITYMTLKAFSDLDFSSPLSDVPEFVAMINPDSFDRSVSLNYNPQKSNSHTRTVGKFKNFESEKYDFTLTLDGTGVINGVPKDVNKEIENLERVLFIKRKESYEPNPVQIQYCGRVFNCMVTSLGYNYTLFDTGGKPLRVKVKCAFASAAKVMPKEKKEASSGTASTTRDAYQCPVCDNQSPEANYSSAEQSNANSLMCR